MEPTEAEIAQRARAQAIMELLTDKEVSFKLGHLGVQMLCPCVKCRLMRLLDMVVIVFLSVTAYRMLT